MTATTEDRATDRREGKSRALPVKGSTTIYLGTQVCRDSNGYAVSGADTATLEFVGIAREYVDNSAGGDGDEYIEVWEEGEFDLETQSALTIADVGERIYVKDNQTVGLVAEVTNGIYVGVLSEVDEDGIAWIRIDPHTDELEESMTSHLDGGASKHDATEIDLEDAGDLYLAEDVETGLTEVMTEINTYEAALLSTDNGEGASLIGVENASSYFAGDDVEEVLDELGENLLHFARVNIPTASVKAMNATPVQLVAAPGAGKYIDVESIHWWLDFAGVQYDAAAAGDALHGKYTDAAGDSVVDSVAGDVIGGAAADYHVMVTRVAELIPVENAAIVAHIATGEWYAAAGDSPLKVEVRYRIRTMEFATS